MSNAVAQIQEPPVERALMQMEDKFAAALPAHIPAGRFVRAALSALSNAQVARATTTPVGRKSIYDSCLKAASDGLLLDGREAALVTYRSKDGDQWVDTVQYQPMVAGIMKKARNSGEIASIVAQVVYSNDEFEINYVTDGAPIVHKPSIGDRGQRVGAYAIARLKDGSWTQPEFMSWDQIEKIKQRSKSKDKNGNVTGPWLTDEEEMGRKTVIKRAAKYWPTSTDKDGVDMAHWLNQDSDSYEPPLDVTPAAPALKERSAARLLEAVGHDPVTGEVTEQAEVARGSAESELIRQAAASDDV